MLAMCTRPECLQITTTIHRDQCQICSCATEAKTNKLAWSAVCKHVMPKGLGRIQMLCNCFWGTKLLTSKNSDSWWGARGKGKVGLVYQAKKVQVSHLYGLSPFHNLELQNAFNFVNAIKSLKPKLVKSTSRESLIFLFHSTYRKCNTAIQNSFCFLCCQCSQHSQRVRTHLVELTLKCWRSNYYRQITELNS